MSTRRITELESRTKEMMQKIVERDDRIATMDEKIVTLEAILKDIVDANETNSNGITEIQKAVNKLQKTKMNKLIKEKQIRGKPGSSDQNQ